MELYPEPKKLGVQLKYADAQGFTAAIIAGENEWREHRCQIKWLATKQSQEVPYRHDAPESLLAKLRELGVEPQAPGADPGSRD